MWQVHETWSDHLVRCQAFTNQPAGIAELAHARIGGFITYTTRFGLGLGFGIDLGLGFGRNRFGRHRATRYAARRHESTRAEECRPGAVEVDQRDPLVAGDHELAIGDPL